MLDIVNFWIGLGDPFRPTTLRLDSVFQNDFIWIWILHESCNSVHVDEYGLLNRMISISEAQDIPIWKSSVKVENPTARRIPARVFALKTDSTAITILLPTIFRSNSQSSGCSTLFVFELDSETHLDQPDCSQILFF
jgi:hypothetical protein